MTSATCDGVRPGRAELGVALTSQKEVAEKETPSNEGVASHERRTDHDQGRGDVCGADDTLNEAARIVWERDCGFVPCFRTASAVLESSARYRS